MLPTGTITFLFTDVVGNVPIWERDPTAMKAALGRHHAILYAAAQEHHGVVFKILGDEFQMAFEFPENALEAALQVQRLLRGEAWGSTGPLTVRMGLHTGPAEIIQGVLNTSDYAVSHTINRVARIRSAAHGGQILLSSATSELLHGYRPQEIQLRDLGEVYLKGMSIPERVFQVVVPDLPDAFPRLISITHPNHNLPLQLTSFIGREQEIEAVCHLLGEHRLVTITGAGGTGKTRLALQAAEKLLEHFPQGVWLVELAPLSDPTLVPRAITKALDVLERPEQSILRVLEEYLQSRQLLLILDNCEHVVGGVSTLAVQLLLACPNLRILATSREILGVESETAFRCPSMALPPYGTTHVSPPFTELAQFEAMRLFTERAKTVCPDFVLTEADAPVIARICQRLDGIPLAIELAAARTRMLSLEQIAARLDHAFRLLTGGSRSVLPRHQTLKALIDWSYNLLLQEERALLLQLSVFAGSWTLEAAEKVCAALEGETSFVMLQPEAIVDLLGQLVDKSLIQFEPAQEQEPRYRMLETVRQYAHDRLAEGVGGEGVRERHLDYYLSLALQAEPHLRARGARRWLDRLDRELDNLRLAMEWSLSGSIEKGLRLAASLMWFWWIRSHAIEGTEWLERLLHGQEIQRGSQTLEQESKIARGKALNAVGFLANTLPSLSPRNQARVWSQESKAIFQELGDAYQRDYAISLFNLAQTEQDFLECRNLCHRINDPFMSAECVMILSALLIVKNDIEKAFVYAEENLALRQEIGDLDGEGNALNNLALLEICRGNLDRARELKKRGITCYEMVGNRGDWVALSQTTLAYLALLQGDTQQAHQQIDLELSMGRELNNQAILMDALTNHGFVAWVSKDYDLAVARCEEALELAREFPSGLKQTALYILGRVALSKGEYAQARALLEGLLLKKERSLMEEVFGTTFSYFNFPTKLLVIHSLGVLAAAQGQMQRAAVLLGAQDALCGWTMNILSPPERDEYEQALVYIRASLGEEAFSAAWEKGRAMTYEQVKQYVLDESD